MLPVVGHWVLVFVLILSDGSQMIEPVENPLYDDRSECARRVAGLNQAVNLEGVDGRYECWPADQN